MTCRVNPRYCGGSTSFNGTTSTIPTTITSNAVFTTGNGFSLGGWVYMRTVGASSPSGTGYGRILDKSAGNGGQAGFCFTVNISGTIILRLNAGTATSSAKTLKKNTWHHVVATLSGVGVATYYIDGEQTGTPIDIGSTDTITTAGALTIGNRTGATDKGWDGYLDEQFIVPRVLTQAEITALYTTGTLPADTAHFWKLDDLPSTYIDTIGGATGTGTATTYSTNCPYQQRQVVDNEAMSSLSFDGVDDYVTLGQNIVDTASPFTVSLLVRPLGIGDPNQEILDPYNTATYTGFRIQYDDITKGRLEVFLGNGSDTRITTSAIRPREWTEITLKYDGTDVFLYTNARLVGKTTVALLSFANQDWYLGRFRGSNAERFWGSIKSVRGWTTDLTDQQIRDLHFNNIVPTEGLVLDLPLNEGAGTIAYNQSGNGNDGTISGATWCACVPSKKRILVGGNLVKNGNLEYQPPLVAPTTSTGVWVDGSEAGSATNNLFGFATYINANTTGSVSFDEIENALKLVRTSETLNASTWVSLRKTFSAALPIASELPLLVKIKPSTAYTFRFKRKQDGNLATNQSQYRYQTHSPSLVRNLNVATTGNPTTEWVETIVTLTSGANDRYFEFAFTNGYTGFTPTTGILWVKDISLTETTPPTRTLATGRVNVTC